MLSNRIMVIEKEKVATCDKCYEDYPVKKLGQKCSCGGNIVDPKKLMGF